MIDLSISGLVKSFEQDKNILDGVSFQVEQGERVGLLGKNGAGKTTLFRILTGEIFPDEGEVVVAPGKKLGLISQIPHYPEGYRVEDVMKSAFERLFRIQGEMEALTERMAAGEERALRRYGELAETFEREGGYQTETEYSKICNGLGIPPAMRQQSFASLSGGEKTRVNLGRLILENTDILLLDEPTNHLDMNAVEWLEEYLQKFKGTVVAISHDRYFLDRVVSRVVELADGKAAFYSGNYSFYVIEKERRYLEQLKRYEQEQAKIAQLSQTAERMHGWGMGNSKLQRRAFAMEKRIERMRKTNRPTRERQMKARFEEMDFAGDQVLELKDLGKGFGDRMLFEHLDLEVRGGERIALLGDNGTGKSTLLKLIMGEEKPDKGKIRKGPAIRIAYLPQIIHFEHPGRSLLETMIAESRGTPQDARDRLAAFQFRGEDVHKPVSALSGGEQSRLRLCILMEEQINWLILDEPTNHLDIASREWVEAAVEDYEGALLFVSHDRYFTNRFATRIWELENGTITDYPCDFETYRERKARLKHLEQDQRDKERKQEKKNQPKGGKGNKGKSREKQLAACEREIAAAEAKQLELEQAMEEAACDYQRLDELYREKEALEEQILELYQQWEALSEEGEAT